MRAMLKKFEMLHLKSNLQLGLMHSEYFAGIAKYDYGAIASRLDSQSVGALSIVRFGVDNIPNTTQLVDANGNVDYDKISTFKIINDHFKKKKEIFFIFATVIYTLYKSPL